MSGAIARAGVVVPFFNERHRIRLSDLDELLSAGFEVVCVDDGSTDGTGDLLADWAKSPHVTLLLLDQNCGKAEAIRRGLLSATASGCKLVGYTDGDFATPPVEMVRLANSLRMRPGVHAAFGARVQLAGREIERLNHRHYLGRLIATMLSLRTGLAVYDTQCGAKWFRVDQAFMAAIADSFRTRWFFDVELLHRTHAMRSGVSLVREEPLEAWRDVEGGHIRAREYGRIVMDLVRLEQELRKPTAEIRSSAALANTWTALGGLEEFPIESLRQPRERSAMPATPSA